MSSQQVRSKPVIERRFRGMIMPTGSHPVIRRLKRAASEPSIHGTKLWKSSFLAIDYLHKHRPDAVGTVLDAGCGWGITGIWCAKQLGSTVISMDADAAVFPFLDAVAALNGVSTTPLVQRFEALEASQLSHLDLLVASDVCFWDELVTPVGKMIDKAIDSGVKQILITDPERPTFHEMSERAIQRHGGELIEWKIQGQIEARGAILLINNA